MLLRNKNGQLLDIMSLNKCYYYLSIRYFHATIQLKLSLSKELQDCSAILSQAGLRRLFTHRETP